ncbi:hypothetical protein JZO66_05430 [Enterococcus sp. DIV0242_7C1]|uniref:Uncharacterized protein n=1 Tax=Candidatus Enterococcus dunnyi TaxID=1834192 RepID=A0A200IZK6_9ENTE|nr:MULTISPECIES: hypothetical protein [unclassified Enterococcus]MBO0469975.1 hypothetical protein [Enterococcus sp. DIV0242_7C1]OUZ30416.1 hypothetical protein A5889_002704 [Enterococcus sp. 9D6_DIV0238]
MKNDTKNLITKINSSIDVPKESTYNAIEEGVSLGKRKRRKIRYLFVVKLVTVMCLAVIIMFSSPVTNAIEAIFGAKQTKETYGETSETTPKKIEYNGNSEEYKMIKPIKLEKNTKITQKLLMDYAWVPLLPSESGELQMDVVESEVIVHRFYRNEIGLSYLNVQTGQETLEADKIYSNDKGEPINDYKKPDEIKYKLVGNVLEQQIVFVNSSSESDKGYMELSIVDGFLVMFPKDEYDHKKERQVIMQPVEIMSH